MWWWVNRSLKKKKYVYRKPEPIIDLTSTHPRLGMAGWGGGGGL